MTNGHTDLCSLSPGETILARGRAFAAGDFAFIYDSYHPESNFRLQFPDRDAYLEYGQQVLAGEFRIVTCRVLREETAGETARVLFYLATRYRGESREIVEQAHLTRCAGRWLYLRGDKAEREALPQDLKTVDWDDFDRLEDKVTF